MQPDVRKPDERMQKELDSGRVADVLSTGGMLSPPIRDGRLLKLVDRADLGSVGASRESSSLSPPIKL
jgi:hypothetical protein